MTRPKEKFTTCIVLAVCACVLVPFVVCIFVVCIRSQVLSGI